MTPQITPNDDGTTAIELDFSDEGVDIIASTSIIGDTAQASAYLPVFVRDVRSAHSHLFPAPEPTEDPEQ